jgi:hypothetical protein
MEDISGKPKRVLSEAQRLAFLKGREKRMANLEKKRLEKEEAKMASEDFELPDAPPPPKPKLTRKPRVKKPEIVPDLPDPDTDTKIEPEPEPEPEPKVDPEPTKSTEIDTDAFAEKIVGKLQRILAPPKVIRKPRKTTPVKPVPPPTQTNNFSWL